MRFLRAHPTVARRVVLGSILLVAFTLRVWNLNWDEGTHQHPDERYWSIVTDDIAWPGFTGYFDSLGSELNPYTDRSTWVYGTAPLFATKATASFLADGPFPAGAIVTAADTVGIELRTDGTDAQGRPARIDAFDAGYNANLVGRLLSALIDTATVALVYVLGRRLWDARVGLVGAALAAFCVLSIQYSHFHGAEAWVTFFVTAALVASLRLADGDLRPRVAAGVGVLLGLAAASKLIAAAALIVPATALAVAAGPAAWRELRHRVQRATTGAPPRRRTDLRRTTQAILAGLVVLAATGFTFRVVQPYAFDGIVSLDERFTADLTYLSDVNSGGNVPWVVQWIDRTPLWFPLQSAFWWGMGPALALAVGAGVALAVRDIVRYRRYELLVPLVLLAVMLGLVSQQFNPLIRYLLPAYPAAIALAGAAVVRAFDVGRRLLAERPGVGRALQAGAVGVVALTAFWGVAFVNGVYAQEHPRIEASQWMAQNLPADAAISAQIWDDALPLAVPDTEGFAPTLVSFDPFAPDASVDPETGRTKVEELLADLDEVDYVVEASNRIYDSVARVPAKYPATTAYYDALFDGRLGFERVARFRNQPSLFGIDLPSHDAEETFTVYDHPTVTIWAKTDAFSLDRARAILNPSRAALAPDLVPAEASTNAVQLRPAALARAQTGETFSEAFTDEGAVAATPWLWWLVWIQLAAFAVLPWTTRLFAPLADRGYGLSKIIGFTTVGGLAWLTTVWGIADSGRALSWFWMAVVVGAGASGWWHQRHRLATTAAKARDSWIASELVFLSVFGLALWLRSANPDLWEAYLGGEKPMELAYITAIARSGDLPAPDPWFGGGAMNYYYLGWYLLTVPMRALRLLPEVAFNLGVATYAAMTATVAFSAVHNLVAVGARRAQASGRAAIGSGLLGVVLLCGIGNYDAIRQHLDRLQSVNTWTGPADWPIVGPVVAVIGGGRAWISGTPLPRFDWWGPSRVNSGNLDITEFPYFTFLFGDLHPHLMGMVFVGLAASVALAYLLAARGGDRRRGLALAVALGAVTAVSRMVNTWDLPTVAILAVGAVVIGQILAPPRDDVTAPTGRAAVTAAAGLAVGLSSLGGSGGALVLGMGVAGACGAVALVLAPGTADRLLRATGHLGVVAVVHVVATWPYVRTTESYDTGIGGAVATTPLDDHLTHWGLFLVVAVALAIGLIVDERRRRRWDDDPVALIPGTDPTSRSTIAGAAGALALLATLAWLTTSAVFAIGVVGAVTMLILCVREIRRTDPEVGRIVVLGLFALGFAISSGVDLITLENDIDRMNTVFKFWLQAWQLFALAAAAAVWQVVRILRTRPSGGQRSTNIWLGVVAVLVIAGLAYPLLGTRTRVETRFAALPVSLDGLAYLEADPVILRLDDPDRDGEATEVQVRIADDVPIIEWLRDNVAGTPTVAEWAGPAYDWNARIATHTGLQAVVGWEWHQRQQRWTFQETVGQRVAATQRFFRDGDPTEITRYLQAYDVAYVVIGTQERRFGTPEALAAIAEHPALVEVLATERGDGRIYAVDRDALWAQPLPPATPVTDETTWHAAPPEVRDRQRSGTIGAMAERRPNVVFIMSDDHAAHAISAYGSAINATPQIDRLAAGGMRFDATFCTNSICSPSRAAILTGTHNHVNGVTTLDTHLDDTLWTFPKALQAAGYTTGIVGKWHLGHGPGHDPAGFDEWRVLPGQGHYHNPVMLEADGRVVERGGYVTDLITDDAIDFIDRHGDDPFALLVHHKAPHRTWEPAPRHFTRYDDVEIPEPETFHDDLAGRAQVVQAVRMRMLDLDPVVDLKATVPAGLSLDEEIAWRYQRYIKDYLRVVAAIDDGVGRLLDHLDARGLTEDTIVVYTSDQGFFLGDHGWFDKRLMYEESLVMPFLVQYPRRVAAGSVCGEIVTNVDFAPSLLDLCGVDAPDHLQGRSIAPLLDGETPPDWPQSMYYRYWMHRDGAHLCPAHYGIRTKRHKLICYYNDPLDQPGAHGPVDPMEWELFDLQADPYEIHNLADDPAAAAIRADLEAELARLQQTLGDQPYPG